MAEYNVRYESLTEMATVAIANVRAHLKANPYSAAFEFEERSEFYGVSSADEAEGLALDGWAEAVPDAMAIAESAIATVQAELDATAFRPVWDVAGCEVDVARYLSGEPECMIDYEIVPTTRYGRVITLCSAISVSGAVSADTIIRRGHAVAALAFALTRLGYAVELWADKSSEPNNGSKHATRIRTLVKGANDELDPARIMFAYAHPAMNRVMGFGAMHSFPEKWQERVGVGRYYGSPIGPKEDLPEGTIYLPCVKSDTDVPEADVALRQYLTDLGIL